MIEIPVSLGELIDKITILEIKQQRLKGPQQLANVVRELKLLKTILNDDVRTLPEIASLTRRLKEINQALWEIEDAIRECERQADFGDAFIALARAVYHRNDERSAVKRNINQLGASEIVEEKGYADY